MGSSGQIRGQSERPQLKIAIFKKKNFLKGGSYSKSGKIADVVFRKNPEFAQKKNLLRLFGEMTNSSAFSE